MIPPTRRLSVKHKTEFTYAGAAFESVNEVRICPVDAARQHVEVAEFDVTPSAEVSTFFDAFGNRVWWCQVVPAHDVLTLEARATVATAAPPRPVPTLTVAAEWAAVRGESYQDRFAEYIVPSPRVQMPTAVVDFSLDVRASDAEGVAPWADQLAQALYGTLTYERGTTDVDTPVAEVIGHGRGVCQDFAHVFVACCRIRGVAARYVSGWLHAIDRDGPAESHAWAEVRLPGGDWFELDPTHPGEVDDRYVRIAVGRDYGDVMPVRGVYRGGATERMTVAVEMRDLDMDPAVCRSGSGPTS